MKKEKSLRPFAGLTIPLSLMMMLNNPALRRAMYAPTPLKGAMILALARNASCHGVPLSSSHKTRVVMYWNSLSPQHRLLARKRMEDGLSSLT
jgi:hypothetical protein